MKVRIIETTDNQFEGEEADYESGVLTLGTLAITELECELMGGGVVFHNANYVVYAEEILNSGN